MIDWLPKTSADLAAWVQGVGTVLAVLGAIGIAWNESRRARRRARETECAQALRLMRALQAETVAIKEVLKGQIEALERFSAMEPHSDPTAWEYVSVPIPLPPLLVGVTYESGLLPEKILADKSVLALEILQLRLISENMHRMQPHRATSLMKIVARKHDQSLAHVNELISELSAAIAELD